jgi:hypothetical protein
MSARHIRKKDAVHILSISHISGQAEAEVDVG